MSKQAAVAFVWASVVGLAGERLYHAPTMGAAGFWFLVFWIGVALPFGKVIGAAIHAGAEPKAYPEQHVPQGKFKGAQKVHAGLYVASRSNSVFAKENKRWQ